MNTKIARKWPRWLIRLASTVSVFFAIFPILLSVAMPGVGWVIAAINLFLASLLTPVIGRRCLGLCLGMTVVHLFSFGPLSDVQSSPGLSPYFFLTFILAPIVAAVTSLLAPIWRARKRRSV